MVKLRKKITKYSRVPGWVITLEALVVALAVHGLLVLVDVRRPQRLAASAPESPGVTFLSPDKLPDGEWLALQSFITIQNPSLFSRADYTHGYAAQLKREQEREILNQRSEAGTKTPAVPAPVEYLPLALLPDKGAESALMPRRRTADPVPTVNAPLAFNESGVPVQLEHLRVPPRSGAYLPSAVQVRNSSGSVRLHLLSSCGVPELDGLAIRAAAGVKEPGTILIYWPEPPGGGAL